MSDKIFEKVAFDDSFEIDDDFIKIERANPRIDFEQEYGTKFTTSLSAAFKEDEIIYEDTPINMYEDL